MKHFKVITVTVLSSLLASQVAADPLDDAIALFRRQSVNLSTGGTSGVTETSTTTPVSTTPSATPTEPTTPSPTSTTIEISTSTREESTTPSEVTSASETSSQSSVFVPTSITQSQVIVYTTVVDGSTSIASRTTSSVVSTSSLVNPSSLSNSSNGGGSSGLSDSTKKTIGGVVGGVGGALLLAGLGYTAWRIWGKKRNLHDEDAYDPNVAQDKVSSSTDTPFNRTLDQYHQPGPVNQASNF